LLRRLIVNKMRGMASWLKRWKLQSKIESSLEFIECQRQEVVVKLLIKSMDTIAHVVERHS